MMSTPHTNRGTLCIASAGPRMRRMVVRTLIEPARLLSPDRWRPVLNGVTEPTKPFF